MNYNEALEFINKTNMLGSVLGLKSIEKLLSLLDNPQNKLRYIHIGGTNGKGSTSNYLFNILKAVGYKVGVFTSPYLNRINESITVDGIEIPDEDFARILGIIREKIYTMVEEGFNYPTTFEILTAMGFIYFCEQKVDFVVLEVGLGGKKDATNIIPYSIASVFTAIDYDHMDILGDTLEKIASEKAGIIKNNSIVVSYPQEEAVLGVLKKAAEEKNSRFYLCPVENISIKEMNSYGSIFDFSYNGLSIEDIRISMLGKHQIYNACLAITTVLVLREKGLIQVTNDEIKEGLSKAKWPCRLEVLRRNPIVLLDGAHNLQGIRQLRKSLDLFDYERLILCIGILKDKDYVHIAEAISPIADEILITEVKSPRKLDAEILKKEMDKYNENVYIEKDINKLIKKSLELSTGKDLILFCGSLYLVGRIKRVFEKQ